MQLGSVGLGRMGAGMVERLLAGGHRLAACDRAPEARRAGALKGATEAASLDALSLFGRFRSRQDESFADRMLAALHNAVSGHADRRSGPGA